MEAMTSVDFKNCFILILISLFSTFFLFVFFFKKPKNGFDLSPSPSLPIIGHLHLLFSASIHKSFHPVAHEIFKDHDMSVFSHGAIGIDECLVFGAFGFIKAPYGDYWKFMKKLITTNMLGPQALERSRDVRSFEIERFYRSLLEKSMKKHSVEIGEEALRLVNNFLGK
ncbi:cytochrome P450 705A1-like [Brassica napus]|uniref:cytochrome P450 705A1-like n=1 Tax=Brassica napus TaxID=3708 RepID=UPI00207A6E8B|nr:cytochrome P450 705A1-like [Brassica napus]